MFVCFCLKFRVKHIESFRSFSCKINRIARLLQAAFLDRSDSRARQTANDLLIVLASLVIEGRNFDGVC